MNSCIYTGHVRHRRFSPVSHAFTYRLFMMYLDLEELPILFTHRWFWSVERRNLASFRRADHVGTSTTPLDQSVRDLVEQQSGHRPDGPIRLLTHCRYFGYVFNPVSFYFCFDLAGEHVSAIVAEVTNTPWGERHCYVLGAKERCAQGLRTHYHVNKVFHISPFMDMNVAYRWRFSGPATRLAIHMENLRDGRTFFDATMALRREELCGSSLARVLVRYPVMTAKVIGAIHWQALKLWMKGVPVHPHPKQRRETSQVATSHTRL